MQSILSDGYDLDGGVGGLREEIDVESAMPDGIAYYTIQICSDSGTSPVAVVSGGDTQVDPLKSGARVQMYPQTFGPFAIARGNPALIIGAGGADTGGYTVYALTDEQP